MHAQVKSLNKIIVSLGKAVPGMINAMILTVMWIGEVKWDGNKARLPTLAPNAHLVRKQGCEMCINV